MDKIKIAKEAAIRGGNTALSFFKKEHTFHHKGHLSNFATEADLASEKVIYDLVKKNFPSDNFLSEEMGLVDNNGEYTWVVDPIDGTVAFSHGLPTWGVSIALFKKQELILGVFYMPVGNNLYYAEKGKGAYNNKEKISVSSQDNLERSLAAVEYSYPGSRSKQIFPFEKFYRSFPAVVLSSISTAFDLSAIADGRVDCLYEETPMIWDIAAGALIVEEAGGKITDWQNKKLNWGLKDIKKDYQIIVSNGVLHKRLVEELDNLK